MHWKDFKVEIASVSSQIGSGSFPVEVLPSAGLAITSKTGEDAELRALDRRMHELPKPIIGRISNGALILILGAWSQTRNLTSSSSLKISRCDHRNSGTC